MRKAIKGARQPGQSRYTGHVSKAAKIPSTRAILQLKKHKVAFTARLYDYVDGGGTRASSAALGLDEHAVIKTLILEDEAGAPMVVLMHGDREVSLKTLSRLLGKKRIAPCDKETAHRHSGYLVGGTSPFGTRKAMPIYMERSIADMPRIAINGGSRGCLVEIAPTELVRVLQPTLVDVAVSKA